MAAVLDITGCVRASLDEVVEGAHPVARALLLAGGALCRPMAMLWPSDLDMIESPHREAPSATQDVELYALRDAVVGGAGGHAMSSNAYVWASGAYPGYVRTWLENDITPERWVIPARPTRRVARAFAITHFNHVWGHWLTEVYPKLFVVRALAEAGVKAPLLLPRDVPQFIRDVIASTLPQQEILLFEPAEEAVTVDLLMLPDMMNRGYIFHDGLRAALEHEVKASWRPGVRADPHIFVSRRRLRFQSTYREMANAKAVEDEARRAGLSIVFPERLSWADQITVFANASVIVGEFGSGLHNAIVSRAGARVVALNWIVDVQSRIANFRGHEVGYVLPDDGQPRKYTIGGGQQPFTIDLAEFRRRVDMVLDPRRPPRRRRYEDMQVLNP
jgi:O-antigen biosynthesis protein WbqL